MNIAIVGTGYVGLVTGACFAKMGHRVWCVDIDEAKIEKLKQGIIPIYEPGLEDIVKKCYANGTLSFATDLSECIKNVEMVFSAVGTPPNGDGSADLKYVLAVAKRFGELLLDEGVENHIVFVTKSTVPVGTAKKVEETINKELAKFGDAYMPLFSPFSVASNPEFLKEGSAVYDFLKPDRIVVGVEDDYTAEMFRRLYEPFVVDNPNKLIITDVPSAEMIKYASNSMLATRISFMNEIANLCTKVGANIDHVRRGMGSDTRIGSKFLYAGCGYGGSCFPKDVKALIKTGMDNGEEMALLNAVERVNEAQKFVPICKAREVLGGFKGKNILVWGLAFKPETDDVREAPAIKSVASMLMEGGNVYAYDPVAAKNAEKAIADNSWPSCMENYRSIADKFDAEDIDAIILFTEWNEFRNIDWDFVKRKWPNCKMVFDGRNIYNRRDVEITGIKYFGIGR